MADIGTDHAYLPIFLLSEGRIRFAVCADINKGPLDSARQNAAEAGFFDNIDFLLTDGAEGLAGRGITDYTVCGMGGELIADIIERSPHLCDSSVRLILQPMSKQAHLRRYLASRGFAIREERYSYDAGKYYLCLAAEYTGEVRELTDLEAEIGICGIASPEARGYFDVKRQALVKSINGKCRGGESAEAEKLLLLQLDKFLGDLK